MPKNKKKTRSKRIPSDVNSPFHLPAMDIGIPSKPHYSFEDKSFPRESFETAVSKLHPIDEVVQTMDPPVETIQKYFFGFAQTAGVLDDMDDMDGMDGMDGMDDMDDMDGMDGMDGMDDMDDMDDMDGMDDMNGMDGMDGMEIDEKIIEDTEDDIPLTQLSPKKKKKKRKRRGNASDEWKTPRPRTIYL